ncbi:MAG: hypothetical protein A3F73_09505 [Gallionellales bacterium RIFCSPLOWO2_12_FULL_59_22]|nr:MAG: hypothetical protein A3H99_12960 [Gallionellales bacterium RIFCSPLOWO2_02_FULL_59_110]OGT05683.1 MAG: hypothetical protein A2Z65_01455 [Gallionellales bacterium RIFCSPLOWO2_02_58_13]OGT14645.1 MAG: hypothetical protein A3F73_09505 [Gallionellales bacterium RIFCSPLOWO2_12_FULL_59_22]
MPQNGLRLFGKAEPSRHRMGAALSNDKDIGKARERAKLAASKASNQDSVPEPAPSPPEGVPRTLPYVFPPPS